MPDKVPETTTRKLPFELIIKGEGEKDDPNKMLPNALLQAKAITLQHGYISPQTDLGWEMMHMLEAKGLVRYIAGRGAFIYNFKPEQEE